MAKLYRVDDSFVVADDEDTAIGVFRAVFHIAVEKDFLESYVVNADDWKVLHEIPILRGRGVVVAPADKEVKTDG